MQNLNRFKEIAANLKIQPSLTILRSHVVNDFIAAWGLNDFAHREEHFIAVEATAHMIAEKNGLDADPTLIFLAAYFHDLFAWSRFNHHKLSSVYVRTTDHRIFQDLPGNDRELVADACLYHRASGSKEFPHAFAELICSADRGIPGQPWDMVKRAMQTRFFKDPYVSVENAASIAAEHMKEKYGNGGYARLPDMYMKTFGEEVEQQRRFFDELTIEQVVEFWRDNA